jgi:outer membrane protein assembly complex protein YaeT
VRTRRILRVLLVTAGILVVLLVAVMALLHTRVANRFVFGQLQKLLASQDIAIEAADFSYSFIPLRVSTGRIAIHTISTPDLPHFFEADRFSARIRFAGLREGRYRIEDLQLEKPTIQVVIDEMHRDNIPGRSGKTSSSSEPIDLLILKLRSTGGSFALEDRSQQLYVRVPVWDFSMDSEEFQLKTRAASEVGYAGKSLSMDTLEMQGALTQRNSVLKFHSVRMSSPLGDVALNGTASDFSDLKLDLSVDGNIHLKPLRQFLSIKEIVDGEVHVAAMATGAPKELKLTGRLEGREMAVERYRRISMDTDLAVDLGTKRARFTSIRARSSNLSATGNADIALAPTAGESRMDARYDIADLRRVLELYKLSVPVVSRVNGSLRARWPGVDAGRINVNSRVQLTAGSSSGDARNIPVSGIVNLAASRDRLTASIDELDSGALHLTGQIKLQSLKEIAGTVRMDVSDTGRALPQVAGWFGKSLPMEPHLSGPATVDANLEGTLQHPRVDAIVEASGLRLNNLENIRLNASAAYTPGQLELPQFSIQWEADSVTGNGRIGLTAADSTLAGQAFLSNASVQRLLAAAGRSEIPASGNIDVNATVSGTIQDPIINANLSATDLAVYNEALGTLAASATFEKDVVLLDTLTLNKTGGGELRASGRYETTSRSYELDLTGGDLQLNGISLPQGTVIRGDVSLSAQSRGSLDNPGGTLKLSSRELHVNSENLKSVNMDVNVADHQAHITAAAPFYGVTANGKVGIAGPYPAVVDLYIKDADVSRFPTEKLKELSGRLTAEVHATGNLDDIEGAVARASVPNVRLDWRNHAITNDKPIELSYANRELTVFQSDIRFEDSHARFSGKVPLNGSMGELKVEGSASLTDLAGLISAGAPVTAEGQLILDGTLRGNLKRIDPDLTLTLSNGSVASSALFAPLSETNLRAVARNGRLVLENLTANWGVAKVSAQGEATFALLPELPVEIPRPNSPTRLTVDVDQFKLSSMTRPPANTDGTISLKIEAEAPTTDINDVELQVTFPDLQINAGTFALEQVGVSRVEIRDGIANIRQFYLKGPQTDIRLSGSAELRKDGPVAVSLQGESDAAVLSLFTRVAKAIGPARVNVDVGGTLQQPRVSGFMELQDGQAVLSNPRLAAENLQVRLDLNEDRIDVTRLEGTLNGGTIQGQGHVTVFGEKRGEANLTLSGDGIYMEFPQGLKTVSNADLRIAGTYPVMAISGKIDVEEGTYTETLTLGRGLMKYFSNEQGTVYVVDESADVKDSRLDIALRTVSPISVNNNVAQGEIDAELRLRGTLDEPGLTGKIEVDEGARLYFRERRYSVDRGLITFSDEHSIEPVLDVSATTSVRTTGDAEYDITMKISGNASRKLETDLTSSPPLDEADIVSVLTTGRTKDEATSDAGKVTQEQFLSFLAGDLGTTITSGAGRAIGLSEVRIEPSLIGKEAEPTARLTLGKDITPDLNLVYSMNLRDSSDQIWIAEYDFTRRLSASGIRQDDNTFRVQAQHDLLFGLGDASTKTTSTVRRKIGSIEFSGNTMLSTAKLSSAAGLKTGKTYDFFAVQQGRERLEKALYADGRLESRISVERRTVGSTVDLAFRIKEGPRVQMTFEGWEVSDDLRDDVRKAWTAGVIDIQRIADAKDLIESALVKERYYGFQIDSRVDAPTEDAKSVVFKIQPGNQYDELRVVFEGVQSIKETELQSLLKDVGFFKQGTREREQAVPAIESIYRERGFIDVKVAAPTSRLDEQSRTLTTTFQIEEGGLYRFGSILFQGNSEFTSEALLLKIEISPDSAFHLANANKARQFLEELYRKTGYNDANVQFTQIKEASAKRMEVTFNIEEGRQRIVREVQVEGNNKTSKGLVRSQLSLEPDDILSDEKLSKARTNLYDSGAYAFVDMDVTELEDSSGLKPNQVPVRLVARVRELQPWELKYGGYLDTERGPGVIADFSNRNMLGNARVLGMQVRFDGDLREGRMYFSQPAIRRFPVKSLFSAFKSHEEVTDEETKVTTITDKKGLSPTLEYKFQKSNTIGLGYRLERTHEYLKVPDPLVPDALARTAPVTPSFTRDTRDDPFDATHGHFMSHAVDWGLGALGSDLHYVKYFGQFSEYIRLGKPSVVPWTREVRNRLVLACGVRVGLLMKDSTQDFRTELFKTGGGTTVRGFQQDRLGPLDAAGNPTGGDAELIINTELRFPMYKFFDGVAFVDAGNVYPTVQQLSPFDIKPSVGFGLRIRTPYLLLRLDYGINIKPQKGAPRGQFFVTFGQAF